MSELAMGTTSDSRPGASVAATDSGDTAQVADDAADDADGESIVAIVPAYNEEETVADVIRGARPYVDAVVVIDDASTDGTEAVAREHADGVVCHPENLGVGGAVQTGWHLALRRGYDRVVQLDADGQHDPAQIPDLLARMDETGADMVVGSRWLNDSHREYNPVRRLGIRFFTTEANLLGGTDVTDVTSGFRVYDAAMLADLGRPANRHWALEQTLDVARRGYDIEEVSVPMPPAAEGSQFDLGTYARYPFRMALTTVKVLLFR